MHVCVRLPGRSKFQTRWNLRFAPRTMPDACDGDNAAFRQDTIYNSVRREDYLADIFVLFFRHHPPGLRELLQQIHFSYEPKTKRFGRGLIFRSDESHDIAQIISRMT